MKKRKGTKNVHWHPDLAISDSEEANMDSSKGKQAAASKKKKVVMYEVEVILAARVNKSYTHDYLVKWFGYLDTENTWEPYESVKDCKRLLKSFWSSIPYDSTLFPVGHILTPPEDWIRSEKIYYRTVVRKAHEDLGMNKRKKTEIVEIEVKLEAVHV